MKLENLDFVDAIYQKRRNSAYIFNMTEKYYEFKTDLNQIGVSKKIKREEIEIIQNYSQELRELSEI